jgi:hypothetical protein
VKTLHGKLAGFKAADATNRVYTATYTPKAAAYVWDTISVAENLFKDAAGNFSLKSADLGILTDTIRPTVTITAPRDTKKQPVKAGEATVVTFTLSEPSSTFDRATIDAVGGTIGTVTGSGTRYEATFTPTANFTGVGRVALADGAFADLAGNGGLASELSLSIDAAPPGTPTLTRTGPVVNVAGLDSDATWSLSLDGGLSWRAGSGTAFGLPVPAVASPAVVFSAVPTYAARSIQVRQTDAAGNIGLVATFDREIKFTQGATAFALDDFTLANGRPLDSTKWTVQNGSFAVTNAAIAAVGADAALAVRKDAVQVNSRVSAVIAIGGGQSVGLVTRSTGSGTTANRYVGSITKLSDGRFEATIERVNLGVSTRLASAIVAKGTGTLVFDAVGAMFTLSLDNQIIASALDVSLSAISVAGVSGIRLSGAGATLDGFRGRTLSIQ